MNTLWEDSSICSGSPSPTVPTQNAFGNCQDPPVTMASASLWSWWPGWWSLCSSSYWGLLTWEAPAFLESPPVLTVDRTHQPLLWTNILVWEAVIVWHPARPNDWRWPGTLPVSPFPSAVWMVLFSWAFRNFTCQLPFASCVATVLIYSIPE